MWAHLPRLGVPVARCTIERLMRNNGWRGVMRTGSAKPRPCARRQGHPLAGGTIHHCDAGSQYTVVRFGETLLLEGLIPSIGTVGDALDKTTIGLYKTECVRDGSPFRCGPITTLAHLHEITSAWVHWYNTSRLMHRLGRRPPAEAEADYYATIDPANPPVHTN